MRDGWRETTLGDVTDTLLGKTLARGGSSVEGGQPYLRNVNVQWGRVSNHGLNEMIFSDAERELYELKAGDILICEGGEVGRLALLTEDLPGVYFQNALHRVRASAGDEPGFIALALEHLVRSGGLEGLVRQVTIAHLNQRTLRQLPITLPPLDEQRRIVDLIAAVDDAVDAAEGEAQAARRTLTDIGSVSNERVTSGDWATVTLAQALGSGSIMTGPFGSALHQQDYRATGTPVVMPKNISGQRVDYDGIARIGDEDVERLKRYQTRAGDILWSRRGDVTRFAVIGDADAGSLCGTGCFIVRPEDAKVTPWLEMWMATPLVKQWLTERAVGATMANLNTALLGEVPVADVPEEERDALVSSISSLHAAADGANVTAEALRTLRSNLLTVLLSGEHEIPSSYDALLEQVA